MPYACSRALTACEPTRLCVECSCLVENHEKIRELSMTHKNVDKVLDELEDIIDLPARWGAGGSCSTCMRPCVGVGWGGGVHHRPASNVGRGWAGAGQWAVGSGQWAVGSGQWAVGSGQWAVGGSPVQLQHMHVAMWRDQHPCSYQSCSTSKRWSSQKKCGSP